MIILLVVVFGVSAVYGGIVAVIAAGSLKALLSGVSTGAYLAFSAFGVETAAFRGGETGAWVATQFLPLPWLGVPLAATWFALRFAFPRLARDRATVLAFAGKLAVSFGIVMAILAAVLSVGEARSEDSTGFTAQVSGGEAWAYSTFIVGVAALVILHLRGTSVVPDRLNAHLRAIGPLALEGARAYALMALALGAVAAVAAVIVVDTGSDRLATVLGLVFMGITMGVVAASYAMGAAIGLVSGHTSLFNFGFPPDFDAGAAPVPFFLLLAVAPGLVAWAVWRRLEKDRPTSEQDVMRIGFIIAIAFAVVSWLAAILSRVALAAAASKDSLEGATGTFLQAQPSVAGTLGLSLLWAIVGGLGAAFYWARLRGVTWMTPPDAAPVELDQPRSFAPESPPPRAAAPAADAVCSNCGAPVTNAGPFCANCGTRVS